MVSVCVLLDTQNLKVTASKRHLTIKFQDLTNYMGARARRGNLLPKGYQNLSKIEAVSKSSKTVKIEDNEILIEQ